MFVCASRGGKSIMRMSMWFRYISIIHPIKISHVHRRRRFVLIFFVIWSVGILMASPNLFLLTLHPLAHRPGASVCGLSDHYSHSKWILAYKYIESIFFFFIPIFVQVSRLMNIYFLQRKSGCQWLRMVNKCENHSWIRDTWQRSLSMCSNQ